MVGCSGNLLDLGEFRGVGEDFSIIWAVIKSLEQHEHFFCSFLLLGKTKVWVTRESDENRKKNRN